MIQVWSTQESYHTPEGYVRYCLDAAVRKQFAGQAQTITRDPAPELLSGEPGAFLERAALLSGKHKIAATTFTFKEDDLSGSDFEQDRGSARKKIAVLIDLFCELLFAGIPVRHRPVCLISTHRHVLGQFELNIGIPLSIEAANGNFNTLNPNPSLPFCTRAWDALGDLLNSAFGWSDPRCPSRQQSIKVPDKIRKELEEAERQGCQISELAPQHLICKEAIALSKTYTDRRGFIAALEPTLARTNYCIVNGWEHGALTLGAKSGPRRQLKLRGKLLQETAKTIETQITKRYEFVRTATERFLIEWRVRALRHLERYGDATWQMPEPDLQARLKAPFFSFSTTPTASDFSSRKEERSVTPVSTLLLPVLRRIGSKAKTSILTRQMATADVSAFTNLKKSMETLNDYYALNRRNSKDADAASERTQQLDRAAASERREGFGGDAGRSDGAIARTDTRRRETQPNDREERRSISPTPQTRTSGGRNTPLDQHVHSNRSVGGRNATSGFRRIDWFRMLIVTEN